MNQSTQTLAASFVLLSLNPSEKTRSLGRIVVTGILWVSSWRNCCSSTTSIPWKRSRTSSSTGSAPRRSSSASTMRRGGRPLPGWPPLVSGPGAAYHAASSAGGTTPASRSFRRPARRGRANSGGGVPLADDQDGVRVEPGKIGAVAPIRSRLRVRHRDPGRPRDPRCRCPPRPHPLSYRRHWTLGCFTLGPAAAPALRNHYRRGGRPNRAVRAPFGDVPSPSLGRVYTGRA